MKSIPNIMNPSDGGHRYQFLRWSASSITNVRKDREDVHRYVPLFPYFESNIPAIYTGMYANNGKECIAPALDPTK